MMAKCRDELICDLAETYHIFDIRSLPLKTVATLSCGLRENSRTKRKLSEEKFTFEQTMLMHIFDKLNWLCWTKTKDAAKGRNCPEPIAKILLNEKPESDIAAFSDAEEFEQAKRRILKGG